MVRRSARNLFKKQAEKTYPWRVDLDPPPDGWGHRLNFMHDWCRATVTEWAQHGYQRKAPGEVPIDVLRFYFMDPFEAELFQAQFGGRLVKRSDAEGTVLIPSAQGRSRVA